MTQANAVVSVVLASIMLVTVGCGKPIEDPQTPASAEVVGAPAKGSQDASRLHYDEGKSLFDRELWHESIAEFTKALELDPQLSLAYYYRGRAFRALEGYQEAIANFTKAVELDPELSLAYYDRLGLLLSRTQL
jgi:tetratricopeptide (TPR) repeat protein